jgi:ribosomal protein L16 Arg81 hydroxylase
MADIIDEIFEIPNYKVQKEDPEIKAYIKKLEKESKLTDAEIEPDLKHMKKERKKHNIPPEKLEIMKANLKKGRETIKARKEAKLKETLKEEVIKEMKIKEEIKKELKIEKPKIEKVLIEKQQVQQPVKQIPMAVVPIVQEKPLIIKTLYKKSLW